MGESYFSPQQIQLGMQLAKAALKVADEKQQQNPTPDSLNQPATGHP
jgi:hypothetical protein